MKVTQSCLTPWTIQSPGQNTGVGSLSLLQEIFPTQGSNPGLPHCRQILYQLSHKGNPRILEWVTNPSPGYLPDPEIKLGSPALQVDSSLSELLGKPLLRLCKMLNQTIFFNQLSESSISLKLVKSKKSSLKLKLCLNRLCHFPQYPQMSPLKARTESNPYQSVSGPRWSASGQLVIPTYPILHMLMCSTCSWEYEHVRISSYA